MLMSDSKIFYDEYTTILTNSLSLSFLLLMSDGLYKSYQDATGSEQVNKEIAQMVVEKVSNSLTLKGKTLTV